MKPVKNYSKLKAGDYVIYKTPRKEVMFIVLKVGISSRRINVYCKEVNTEKKYRFVQMKGKLIRLNKQERFLEVI